MVQGRNAGAVVTDPNRAHRRDGHAPGIDKVRVDVLRDAGDIGLEVCPRIGVRAPRRGRQNYCCCCQEWQTNFCVSLNCFHKFDGCFCWGNRSDQFGLAHRKRNNVVTFRSAISSLLLQLPSRGRPRSSIKAAWPLYFWICHLSSMVSVVCGLRQLRHIRKERWRLADEQTHVRQEL